MAAQNASHSSLSPANPAPRSSHRTKPRGYRVTVSSTSVRCANSGCRSSLWRSFTGRACSMSQKDSATCVVARWAKG